MATGSDLIAMIASRQNLADYQKKHWHGTFAEYLDIVRDDPKVTRTAYQRVYDMILSHGTEETVVNKEKVDPLQVLRRPGQRRPGRHLRPREDAHQPRQHPHERRAAVRHRAPGPAPARARRQLQEHDRPAPEEGAGGVLQDRRGGRLHLRLARGGARRRRHLRRLPDARGAAPPDPRRAPRRRSSNSSTPTPTAHGLPRHRRGGPLPLLPPDVQRADGQRTTATGPRSSATSGSAA